MNQYDIEFILDNTMKMVIELDEPLQKMSCYCQTPVVLIQAEKNIVLSVDDIYENMIMLRDQLSKALDGELILHPSITNDIGYLYNQYLRYINEYGSNNPTLSYEIDDGFEWWVGYKAQLWSYDLVSSWLYNDSNNEIVFEVTPIYPEMFLESQVAKNMISYKEWMTSYRPAALRVISKDVAFQWFDNINSIVAYIEGEFNKNGANDLDGVRIYQECHRVRRNRD
jgi:hypothetical protein